MMARACKYELFFKFTLVFNIFVYLILIKMDRYGVSLNKDRLHHKSKFRIRTVKKKDNKIEGEKARTGCKPC